MADSMIIHSRGQEKPERSGAMQADARIDPESLERDNDRDIDTLADKTSFLRKVRPCT